MNLHLLEIVRLIRTTFGGTLSTSQRERLETISADEKPFTGDDRAWISALVNSRGL